MLFGEDEDLALVGFDGFEIEEDVGGDVGFQVPDQDVVPSGFQDHHLSFAQHCEGVNILTEHFLFYNFAF